MTGILGSRWQTMACALGLVVHLGSVSAKAGPTPRKGAHQQNAELPASDSSEPGDLGPDGGRDSPPSMPEQRARSLIAGWDEFDQVTVSQRGSLLVLDGTVGNVEQKAALIALMSQVEGVVHVFDRTKVQAEPDPSTSDASIQQRLAGVFANVTGLEQVQVNVRSGVVRLKGESPSARLIDKAEQLATASDGVLFVQNEIEQTAWLGAQVQLPLDRFQAQVGGWIRKLPILLIALLIVLVSFFLASMAQRVEFPYRWFHRALLRDIVKRIVGTLVVVVGVLIALELLEMTSLIGAVFGAAGAAGIILGFAFREIIENYLASILLSVRRPFSANDHVLIGEREGKVIRMTFRDTILMTLEGNHLRLPNSVVFKAEILNYTRNPLRRFDFSVGLGVKEDIGAAVELGRSELSQVPGVCQEPPCFARVEELGESNVALRFFCWVDQRTADWFKVRSEAIRRTKVALDEAGVDMPVPIYQVNVDSSGSPDAPPSADRSLGERSRKAAHEVVVDDYLERQMELDRKNDPKEGNLLTER